MPAKQRAAREQFRTLTLAIPANSTAEVGVLDREGVTWHLVSRQSAY